LRGPQFSDLPLTEPGDDGLGYAQFAQRLAQSIAGMRTPEGMVLAIQGASGYGRSTCLNFVKFYADRMPAASRPQVVVFNPWWYAGPDELVRGLFDQLISSLEGETPGLRKLRSDLARLAEAVSPATRSVPGSAGRRPSEDGSRDLAALQEEVRAALRVRGRRTLVMIDDIDQLTQGGVNHLFRVLNAVARFPEVAYLLAFDRARLDVALGRTAGKHGAVPVDKIVQVGFDLPVPAADQMRRLLLARLDAETAVLSAPADETYSSSIYFDGIGPLLSTPRDVVRLTNAIRVTQPFVEGEVHRLDFVAIQALRVLCPIAYEVVRDNQAQFVGEHRWGAWDGSEDLLGKFKSFHSEWIALVPEHQRLPVRNLLVRLFPRLHHAWPELGLPAGPQEPELTQRLHVASPRCFETYFRLSLPAGSVGRGELKRVLVAAWADPPTLESDLMSLAQQKVPEGSSRLQDLLRQLCELDDNSLPEESVSPLVSAMLSFGDDLWLPGDFVVWTWVRGNDILMVPLTIRLIRRMPPAKRPMLLKGAIDSGRSLCLPIRVLTELAGAPEGPVEDRPEAVVEDSLLSTDLLVDLHRTLLARTRKYAADGRLLDVPDLRLVLRYWRAATGSPEEPARWAQATLKGDAGFVHILTKYLVKGHGTSTRGRLIRPRHRLDPEWLKELLDPEAGAERARRLAGSGRYAGDELLALRQYAREHDMRAQGLNPNELNAIHE